MTAVVLPLGAVVTGFVMVAVPTILLMTVWTIVTVLRILFPERPLPFDPASRRRRATMRGESVPVRLRDIMEDQARQPLPARRVDAEPGVDLPERDPLLEDLWRRRN